MFGPHVDRVHAQGTRPDIHHHIRAARDAAAKVGIRVDAFQIFIAGPRQMEITLGDREAEDLRAFLAESGLHGVAHSVYVTNPWRDDHKSTYSASFIRRQSRLCKEAGLKGLVVHLPPKEPPAVVAKYAPRLYDLNGVRIYYEIPQTKPENSYYESPANLAKLFKGIQERFDAGLDTVGVCIDTAHLWSCGVDISSREKAEEWLETLQAEVFPLLKPGQEKDFVMFHLNDSREKFGAGVDSHDKLFEGQIWRDYRDRPAESGLAAFVQFAVKHGNAAILERKPPDASRLSSGEFRRQLRIALADDYMFLHGLDPHVRI